MSSKQTWMIWLAPAAAWAIYMCWLAGYRSGFEQGHAMAWDSAHHAFATVEKPLPNHYQWVALAAKSQPPLATPPRINDAVSQGD